MTERYYYCSNTAPREAGQPGSPVTSGLARTFAILTLAITLVGLVGAVLFSGMPLRDDAALLLDCARLIIHGWLPYVEFADINPPIAHYVHMLPVYIAGGLNLDIPFVFHICVLTLIVYSAAALLFLLPRLTPVFSLPSRFVLSAVCILFSLWVLRAGEFGQREHLFTLAYIPWLYCREIRHGSGDVPALMSIVIGLISAPLFLLKPHFCMIVALVEAWLLFISRRFSTLWSPEILTLAAWVVGYAVHFGLLPSEMREAFFFRWLPFAIANYDVYNHPFSEITAMFSAKFWLFQIISRPRGISSDGQAVAAR